MASTPTKNPVPSESYVDLRYNSGVLDAFLNSTGSTITDRLGKQKPTLADLYINAPTAQQVEAARSQAVSSAQSALDSKESAESSASQAASSASDAVAAKGQANTFATQAAASAQQAANVSGITDGSNAAAGKVGEYKSSSTLTQAISSNVAKNAASISLPAGDWEVNGVVQFQPSSAFLTDMRSGITTQSLTLPSFSSLSEIRPGGSGTPYDNSIPTPAVRLNVTQTTTVYLYASAEFSSGSCNVNGFIQARRIR